MRTDIAKYILLVAAIIGVIILPVAAAYPHGRNRVYCF